MKIFVTTILLLLVATISSFGQNASTVCKASFEKQSETFFPVYPATTDIKPGHVLRLELAKGEKTDLGKCIRYTTVNNQAAPNIQTAAVSFAAIKTNRNNTGDITLSNTKSARIPLSALVNLGLKVKKNVVVSFPESVSETRIPEGIDPYVVKDNGDRLSDSVYNRTNYAGFTGFDKRKGKEKFHYFLIVEKVYQSKKVNVDFFVDKKFGGDAKFNEFLNNVPAEIRGNFSLAGDKSVKLVEDATTPFVYGMTGRLVVVDGNTGLVVSQLPFPFR